MLTATTATASPKARVVNFNIKSRILTVNAAINALTGLLDCRNGVLLQQAEARALAAASGGIGLGGGTEAALETADAAVLNDRVGDVAALVSLSRATLGNIRQNVAIALGLKAVFLVTTIAGITGLWPAILADTGATVLVTANALRLLRA